MEFRIEVTSRETGNVLFASRLDVHNPEHNFTRRDCQKAITVMRQAEEKMREKFPQYYVRLRAEDIPTSVFWYYVLHRPIVFDPDDPLFGKRTWTVFEMLEKPLLANKLKEMNLGLVYDPDNRWLTVVWDEALTGVLEGMEKTPSWNRILDEVGKRLGSPPMTSWWRLCASNHAFAVPTPVLRRKTYIQQKLWHRPGVRYNDITVFDVAGMDLPKIGVVSTITNKSVEKVVLPPPKRASFVHFYTEDKDEFTEMQQRMRELREMRNKERRYTGEAEENTEMGAEVIDFDTKRRQERRAWEKAEARQEARAKMRAENAAWIGAGNCMFNIIKIMGIGAPGKRDTLPSERLIQQLFSNSVAALRNGKFDVNFSDKDWGRVEEQLDALEGWLRDSEYGTGYVPSDFGLWLQWRNRGASLLRDFEQGL